MIHTLHRFFLSHVSFLPVHNSVDCVEAMTTIAKVTMTQCFPPLTPLCDTQVTCLPLRNIVRQRFDCLIQKQVTEDILLSIIAQTGMTEHGKLPVTSHFAHNGSARYCCVIVMVAALKHIFQAISLPPCSLFLLVVSSLQSTPKQQKLFSCVLFIE